MNHENYDLQLQEWLRDEDELDKKPFRSKPFIGDRQYRHFDARVPLKELQTNEAEKLLNELRLPAKLAQHPFYPFVRKDKKIRRFVKVKDLATRNKKVEIKQKNRPIMYASHRDAVIYGFYGWMLKRLYDVRLREQGLDESVIAYRKIPRNDGSDRNKSNIDFSNDIFRAIGKHQQAAIMCLDITDFFGTMDHQLLRSSWKDLLGVKELPVGHLTVFKNITRYRHIFLHDVLVALKHGEIIKGRFRFNKDVAHIDRTGPITKTAAVYNAEIKKLKAIRTNGSPKGIPQGSPISDILANLYLLDFDKQINDLVASFGMGMYRRYSDDIMIVCPIDSALDVYKIVSDLLAQRNLLISEKKSELFHLDRAKDELIDVTSLIVPGYENHKTSVQYLGFEFDLNDIHIRAGTIANYYRKFVGRLKRNRKREPDPYIIVEQKPKAKSNRGKKEKRDRYAYIKKASARIGSKRLERQFLNVRKRTTRLRHDEKDKNE